MTDSKTSRTEAETTLDNEELAEVQGGLSVRDVAGAFRLDLGRLRERLNLGSNRDFGNYHIKDSGPSWVNSPRNFDRGDFVTLPILNRF